MTREFVLFTAILLSVVLMYLSFRRMNQLTLSKSRRLTLTYLTLFIPLLGYFFVLRYRQG